MSLSVLLLLSKEALEEFVSYSTLYRGISTATNLI